MVAERMPYASVRSVDGLWEVTLYPDDTNPAIDTVGSYPRLDTAIANGFTAALAARNA